MHLKKVAQFLSYLTIHANIISNTENRENRIKFCSVKNIILFIIEITSHEISPVNQLFNF